jgi:choline monooxygenase
VTDWKNDQSWAGTRAALRSSTGLDPDAYASQDFFDVEQQRVFERAWVCVGMASEVAESGRLLVRSVGSRSIIVTRDQDGTLQGFLNSCRHRGTELAEADCEVANTIRCPYHRWGYALDGRLVATPFFDEVPRDDFDKDDFGLVQVRVNTWGCLLFVCLSEATPPLLDWLGDLPERMAGYDLESWQPRLTQQLNIKSNWKLISEHFQEYYHLTWIHPELAKVSRVADHYRYQGPGMYCGQTTTPVSGDERNDWLTLPPAPDLDQSDSVSGRFVAIFPNVLLSVLPNHVFVMRLDPAAPGLTHETCTWLLPAESANASDEAFEPTRKFWIDVNAEDIDIVQRGQRGLARGAVPAGPLAPRFEEPLYRFQNILVDCMTLAELSAITVPSGDSVATDRLGTAMNPAPAAIDIAQL